MISLFFRVQDFQANTAETVRLLIGELLKGFNLSLLDSVESRQVGVLNTERKEHFSEIFIFVKKNG